MRTLKIKKNKRNTRKNNKSIKRKGGMMRRMSSYFRRTPVIPATPRPEPVNNDNFLSQYAAARYAVNAPSIEIPLANSRVLTNEDVIIMTKENIMKFGTLKMKEYVMSNEIVCILLNNMDYGVFYEYRNLSDYSYYTRLPKEIIYEDYIYPQYIEIQDLSEDMSIYHIPDEYIPPRILMSE
jgi:hypothetical protein